MDRGDLALKVFAADGEARAETLKLIWPELHDALAGLAGDLPDRQLTCASGRCAAPGLIGPRPVAVGRLNRGGAPACRPCIDRYGDGGSWPLAGATVKQIGEISWPVLNS